jgi:nitrate/nitrite transporter NarK
MHFTGTFLLSPARQTGYPGLPENLLWRRYAGGSCVKLLRSIASVVLSYIVVYGIVAGSDPVLTHFFPTQYVRGKVPPAFLLWTSTAIYALATILGGWLCVRIAPSKPGVHLFILFLVGEIIGLGFTIMNWGAWPHWTSIVWMLVWPIFLWIGGRGRKAA